MTEYTRKKARELRIPEATTPERMECDRFAFQSKVVTFGKLTIAASYTYRGNGKDGYFWAAYRFTNETETTCEDEIRLEAVSCDFYGDDGHALAAAFEWAAQWA
jgi:hypothetical protein